MLPLSCRHFVILITALGLLAPYECSRGILVITPIGILDDDRHELRVESFTQQFYLQFNGFHEYRWVHQNSDM